MVGEGNSQFNFDLEVLNDAEGEITNTVINSIEDLDQETNILDSPEDKAKKEGLSNKNPNDGSSSKTKKEKKDETNELAEDIIEIESIEDLNNTEDPDDNEESLEVKEDKNKKPEGKLINTLKVFGENLQTKGLIDFNLEEFDKAEDKDIYFETKVAEKIAEGSKALYEEQIGELPSEIKELVDLHKQGVPLYNLLEADKRIAEYETIKPEVLEENEGLQKELVRSLFEAQGVTKEKIDAKVKRYEDLGTLKDEAIEALDTLKEYEKSGKEEMIREEKEKATINKKKMEDRVKAIEDSINKKENIMGLPLTKEQKKVLIDGILKPIGKTADGKAYNAIAKAKMDDSELDLKLAYFTLILKGDLTKVEKQAQTKAVKKLASTLEEENIMNKGSLGAQSEDTKGVDLAVVKGALEYLRNRK